MSQKDLQDIVTPDLTDPRSAREPYTPPTVEVLGGWTALTLAQTVPIVVGGLFPTFIKDFRE
ncbi:hypothetical protein FNU79_16400 [Deinococcus detaillensis]|uniref:Uncharacterized protein n=1 Tax=Deinococcus detaillensis TaxID=2592048 RepID=A0A553UK81_9DEIO|nr:hypothetical protein [Deinococcus detaillensis]TSA80605.1 hypothetical protein FNU79_16400 [Deinococcus detaillensis]